MKLTRHLGIQMAERRENHPMTLHSETKCLKNTVLILKTFYCVAILTLLLKPYTLLSICKKILTFLIRTSRDLTASARLFMPDCKPFCVLLQRLIFSHPQFESHPVCSAPEGAALPLPGVGRRWMDVTWRHWDLCWREAGATTGIPRTSSAIYKTMSPAQGQK